MEQATNKNFVNLSSLNFKQEVYTILEKGLKFCPTPNEPNIGELREDMDRLHTHLKQMAFFKNPENHYETKVTPSQCQTPNIT